MVEDIMCDMHCSSSCREGAYSASLVRFEDVHCDVELPKVLFVGDSKWNMYRGNNSGC